MWSLEGELRSSGTAAGSTHRDFVSPPCYLCACWCHTSSINSGMWLLPSVPRYSECFGHEMQLLNECLLATLKQGMSTWCLPRIFVHIFNLILVSPCFFTSDNSHRPFWFGGMGFLGIALAVLKPTLNIMLGLSSEIHLPLPLKCWG